MSITRRDFCAGFFAASLGPMELWERIRAARLAAKLSQKALGKVVRVKQNAISRWETQGDNRPDIDQITEIARGTGVRVEWLAHESGPMIASPDSLQPKRTANVNIGGDLAKHVTEVPMSTGDDDLPILGRAKGGDNAHFITNGDIVGYTVRPQALRGVKDAYAIEVWDTSMEPALEHGWTCWVHPHKPVKPGDRVVVQLADGQALVKRLVRRTAKEVVFEQFNPARRITFKPDEIAAIHLILGNLSVRI